MPNPKPTNFVKVTGSRNTKNARNTATSTPNDEIGKTILPSAPNFRACIAAYQDIAAAMPAINPKPISLGDKDQGCFWINSTTIPKSVNAAPSAIIKFPMFAPLDIPSCQKNIANPLKTNAMSAYIMGMFMLSPLLEGVVWYNTTTVYQQKYRPRRWWNTRATLTPTLWRQRRAEPDFTSGL